MLIFACIVLRLGGGEQECKTGQQWAECLIVCIYCKFRAKMGAFLYFWVMSGNFHSFLPKFLIWEFFWIQLLFFMDFSSQKRPKTLNFDLCTLKKGYQMKLVWLGNLWAHLWEYKANDWLLYIFYWLQFGFSNAKILIFYLKIKKIKK